MKMKTTGYNSLKSWSIVVVCSTIFSVSLLPFRAAPIYYVALLDRYATNRESVSYTILIPNVLRCFVGPVAGFLCEILGIRAVMVVGCFLCALGIAVCFFAEDIAMVIVFKGLIFGIGMILGIPLLPQAIKPHFQTNITIANGVFRAVSCILTLASIPLISFLLDIYGCSGMLLLTGGIVLHTVPMAMLLGDPKYARAKNFPGNTSRTDLNLEYRNQSSNVDARTVKNLLITDRIDDCNEDSHVDAINIEELQSNKDIEGRNKGPNVAATNVKKLLPNNRIEQNNEMGDYVEQSVVKGDKDKLKYVENGTISCTEPLNDGKSQLRTPNAVHPLLNVRSGHNQISEKDSSQSQAAVNKNKFRQACLTLTVFKDPCFVVIMLTQSGSAFVNHFVLPVLIDYSRDKGIRKDVEDYLIMGYSLFQIVGYSCLGWLVDKGFVKISNYVAAHFLCLGLSCCAIRFSNDFAPLIVATACFGIFNSAISSAGPTLIYEFIGLQRQTMAISSGLILMSPLSLAIAPLIGYFRGKLDSYDGAFYVMTSICVACAVLILMLPYVEKCRRKKNDNSLKATVYPQP